MAQTAWQFLGHSEQGCTRAGPRKMQVANKFCIVMAYSGIKETHKIKNEQHLQKCSVPCKLKRPLLQSYCT